MVQSTILQRVEQLRQWMRRNGLSAYIFPSTDPHMGEYVAAHWKSRQWISGFTGSAGTAVVTLARAALWTDSRYWLAAEQQLAGTPFEVVRCGSNVAGAAELAAWLAGALGEQGQAVGASAWVSTMAGIQRLDRELTSRGFVLNADLDPVAELWAQRPPLPATPVWVQPLALAGRTVAEKLADIRAELRRNRADALIVSLLDEIAWTLNLRGADTDCTPLFVAYLLVLPEKAILYIDPRKLTPEVRTHLRENGVEVRPYGPIVAERSMTIQYDPEQTNAGIVRTLAKEQMTNAAVNLRFVRKASPITPMKAVKTEAEIAGFRRAMLRDGVAMVKFLRTLSPLRREGEAPALPDMTEMGVDAELKALRAGQEGFRSLSFATIAAYGAHAAIVHYEATPETDAPLQPRGMVLIDSGAQYDCGTTDITRTIALGPLTDEERRDYTLVLKGFLRLSMAVFPEGTTGTQLDVLARYAMWQDHKNYGHGTGHGVGSYLCVHEGPHQFRMNWVPAPLRAGMTVTVEPGIYIAGSHGVRTENTMLISEAAAGWLCLEPLTLCPIDTTPIVVEMLLPDEVQYLNNYHARVREALLPLLDDEEDRTWLIEATSPLKLKNEKIKELKN